MTDRRAFLLGASVTMAASTLRGQRAAVPSLPDPLQPPDLVTAFAEGSSGAIRLERAGDRWQANDIEVATELRQGDEVAILITAPHTRLTRVRFRWHGTFPAGWRFLGDQWERSYGDLEWRGLAGERLMPWYFLACGGGVTNGYGVKTGASSICCWQADDGGTTLWLDVGNGGTGVELAARRLQAATIIARKGKPGESPIDAARAFCRAMCQKPILAPLPIYGSNNWYYAYGKNTSSASILKDAALMAELMPGNSPNRPFVVIDMGWGAAPDGAGPVAKFAPDYPDMADLAGQMKATGVRPGIWTRPTLTTEKRAEGWRLPAAGGRTRGDLITMDPSIPEALAYIGESIAAIRGWGYELIKHDYSTFDLTGRWGFAMGPDLTDRGWHFHDRGKTTAEIVLDLYRTIRRNAGDAALIGCNTIGHLAAGLVEAQRIGDDTSGREWSRTRKMGVTRSRFACRSTIRSSPRIRIARLSREIFPGVSRANGSTCWPAAEPRCSFPPTRRPSNRNTRPNLKPRWRPPRARKNPACRSTGWIPPLPSAGGSMARKSATTGTWKNKGYGFSLCTASRTPFTNCTDSSLENLRASSSASSIATAAGVPPHLIS
jgi:alpha-galactosidase